MTQDTRLVGTLPNLRLEMVHRQDPDDGAEHLFLHLALPAPPALPVDAAALLGLWTQAWLAPWAAATRMMLAPRGAALTPPPDDRRPPRA